MSLIDKLKSVFVVPDAGGGVQKDYPTPEKGSEMRKETNTKPIVVPLESSEKFMNILAKVMDDNNQPGFDYLEYKKAVLSIAKLQNMEESAQFKAAYAAAMSMDVQPNHLTDSAKKYLKILETEYQKFNQTANQFLETQVSSREQESIQLHQTIQQKEKQLQQLQTELDKHHKRIVEIESELQSAKSKVETNKTSFKIAYDQLVGKIHDDIQKMEQYLK